MYFGNFPKKIKVWFIFFNSKLKKLKRHYSYWPKFSQWKRVFEVLNKKEKFLLLVFFVLFLGSAIILITNFYFQNTQIGPAFGGKYIEGIIGQPRFLNPIYANSDADRDLVELIFSGLLKYNGRGEIIPDLVKDFTISEDGKTYEVYLKENIFWQDGDKLTSDDIIFTVQTIQNPDYKSPLRANWLGVDIEKISDSVLRFKLKDPYAPFLERLTLKILPKHIWEEILPQNFPLAVFNLKPVGSGPYQFKALSQTDAGKIIFLDLEKFKNYHGQKPFISQISFRFFDSEKELADSFNRGEIKGFSFRHNAIETKGLAEYALSLPRYFALFFNLENSEFLKLKEIRQALNYITDKQTILEKVLGAKGEIINTPILPEFYGLNPPSKIYEFNPEKAENLLTKSGFEKQDGKFVKVVKERIFEFKSDLKKGNQGEEVRALQQCLAQDPEIYPEAIISGFFGQKTKEAVVRLQEKYKEEILEPFGLEKGTGEVKEKTRQILNQICQKEKEILPLKFTLITVEDSQLVETAKVLKEQWQNFGIELEVITYPIFQLKQEIIKPRNYEILLFGEVLGQIPDPFPFWHSSQKKDPGLNLSQYENKKVDKLLEKVRTTLDLPSAKELFEEFQDILVEDAPALFLYRPDYLYFVSREIQGIQTKIIVDSSKRFSDIENWYIKTRRIWK